MTIFDRMRDGPQQALKFYAGTECEHTPYEGFRTLFVVGGGWEDRFRIMQAAADNDCSHVYLGADLSCACVRLASYLPLYTRLKVTVEVGIEHLQQFLTEERYCAPWENESVVVVIRATIPDILVSSRTVLKVLEVGAPESFSVRCATLSEIAEGRPLVSTPVDAYAGDAEVQG